MKTLLKNAKVIDGFQSFVEEGKWKDDGFDPDAFQTLIQLEDRHFWFQERNKLILWSLKKYFPRMENMLEIGCGTAYVNREIRASFPNTSVWGSEFYINGLKQAAFRLGSKVGLIQLDARTIPFPNTFDVIGGFDVLEHIEEDELVLRQIHQALKPGGGLILTVPQHMFLWSKQDDIAHHKRRYSRKELVQKLEAAGFRIIVVTSFVSALMPLLFISRRKGNDSMKTEFQIHPILNRLFKWIVCGERLLIKCKISLPFGSSLLAIGEKK
ncbi:MAG: methyltransferase domain-containing protein [Deltaproteobacteria bacterium]|nr:methyltransferase domain-containing protein [Deltaproteobacteria bacterium]